MDKLERIFAMQKLLDDDIQQKRELDFSYEVWMQKDILATMDELTELLNELNYKWWKNPKPLDNEAICEELADVLHFFISMCIRSGMDADKLFAVYSGKNKENFDRQLGKSSKHGYEVNASEESKA
ncbi:MAG: dUTPase [Clostridia bacterium]|nr:dUTPase [Clostridia bacterium]